MENKLKFIRHLLRTAFLFMAIALSACRGENRSNEDEKIVHVKVFYEVDKYGGWPANWGIWNWGNEILVGFTKADHEDKSGHTFNQQSSLAMLARSTDGGITWSVEDAYESGITESTVEHNLGEKSIPARELTEGIDFSHPDIAVTFRMIDMYVGPSSFYYSYDRGKNWQGAFIFPVEFTGRNPAGIVTRTDYFIDGPKTLTAFFTVGFKEGDKNWREVACIRTLDGGLTWDFLSWVGEPEINSIMPSSVRLDDSRILTLIRRTSPPRMVSFLSEDNGYTWTQLEDPVKVDANGNPPALLKLQDGRLCLVYGIRRTETMTDGIGMYVSFSSDEGKSWGKPILLRGGDGANWDIGYPRSVELPDGKVVAIYYYNNDETGDKFRYIAATILDPAKL